MKPFPQGIHFTVYSPVEGGENFCIAPCGTISNNDCHPGTHSHTKIWVYVYIFSVNGQGRTRCLHSAPTAEKPPSKISGGQSPGVWCTGKAEKLQIKINMVRSVEVFRTEEINLFVPRLAHFTLAPPCDGVTDGNGLMFGKHKVEVPLF